MGGGGDVIVFHDGLKGGGVVVFHDGLKGGVRGSLQLP